MANMEKIKDKLAILPALPGCYLMKNKHQEIIYVGKAKILKNRVRQYFVGAHDYKTTKLVANIDDFEYIICNSEKEALLLEINLIKKHTPPYNIMFMDDKSYPYLQLTNDKAPILKVVRNVKKAKKGELFGPFPNSSAAYEIMKLLNRIYPLRKCKNLGKKPCLYYHINQCLAPCIKAIDEQTYQQMVVDIRKFLKGDVKDIIDDLKKGMDEDIEALAFEKAKEKHELIQAIEHVTSKQQIDFKDLKDRDVFAYYVDNGYISIQGFLIRNGKMLERTLTLNPLYEDAQDAFLAFVLQYYQSNPLAKELLLPNDIDVSSLTELLNTKIIQPQKGDKLRLIQMAINNAKIALAKQFELLQRKDDIKVEGLKQLQKIFNHDLHRIELYDNSHIQGSNNVSGMVVYVDGVPCKNEYRKYKLSEYRSDLDSMKEVIYRRYLRVLKEDCAKADLIIVDGGLMQIEAAKEVLDSLYIDDVLLCGLVKDDHHRTSQLLSVDGEVIDIKKDSPLFFLLTQMQDEVHRFAISFHRQQRSKAMKKSVLDDIEGVGEARKQALWKHFKSLKAIKEASVEQLQEVVPLTVAQNIYETFH